jgi:hypothetical protein
VAVVVVIVEAVFAVAICPIEAAAAGTAGLAKDSESETRDTVLDEVAVTTSSVASGNSGRGNCMRGRGAVSAAIPTSGWVCRLCMTARSKTKTIPAAARLKPKPTLGVTNRNLLPRRDLLLEKAGQARLARKTPSESRVQAS